MFVLGCVFDLRIQESRSLKDKRQVIQGLMEKMRRQFSMSVVETGHQDLWDRSKIGGCFAVNHAQQLEEKLDRITELVGDHDQVEILQVSTDTMKVD